MKPKVVEALLTIVTLCLVVLLCGCQSTSNQVAPSKADEKPLRPAPLLWEYAQLQHQFSYSTSESPVKRRPEHKWSWSIAARGQRQRYTIHELCRDLSDNNKGGSSLLDLLNLIGKMGWELVDYAQESQVVNMATRDFLQVRPQFDSCQTKTWLFKRLKE